MIRNHQKLPLFEEYLINIGFYDDELGLDKMGHVNSKGSKKEEKK